MQISLLAHLYACGCLQGAQLHKPNYVSQDYLIEASNIHHKVDTTYPKVLPLCYRAKKQVTLQIVHLIKYNIWEPS